MFLMKTSDELHICCFTFHSTIEPVIVELDDIALKQDVVGPHRNGGASDVLGRFCRSLYPFMKG